jgi:hypothetical protein
VVMRGVDTLLERASLIGMKVPETA